MVRAVWVVISGLRDSLVAFYVDAWIVACVLGLGFGFDGFGCVVCVAGLRLIGLCVMSLWIAFWLLVWIVVPRVAWVNCY